MKEFVYISDSKIDTMFDQIPSSKLKGFAIELGLDLKVISAKLTKETEITNRINKLELVLAELRKNRLIGSIESAKRYFSGSLKMSWGPLERHPGVTFFGGRIGSKKIGLVGSSRHCLTAGPEEPFSGISDSCFYSEILAEMISDEDDPESSKSLTEDAEYGLSLDADKRSRRKQGLRTASYSIELLKKIEFNMEFVAVRKFTTKIDGIQFIMGSPIYVACK